MGVLDEGAKAVGSAIDAMRSQPLAIALVIMNLGLLTYLYYYTSRITSRTEQTAKALFDAQAKLYDQWGIIIKDTNSLAEKTIHCILPEDAVKLMQGGGGYVPAAPQRPAAPQKPPPLEEQLFMLPKPRPPDAPKSMLFLPPHAPPLTDPVPSPLPTPEPKGQ